MRKSQHPAAISRALALVAFTAVAAAHLVPPEGLHVSVAYNDDEYWFVYGNLFLPQAQTQCANLGGSLLSLGSTEEAVNTIWSKQVIGASEEQMYWTGLVVSWPSSGSGGRRRLRSFALSKDLKTEIAPAIIHQEVDADLRTTSGDASASGSRRALLSTGLAGRAVPDEVRQWQLRQERRRARALLGRKTPATDGDDRFNLKVRCSASERERCALLFVMFASAQPYVSRTASAQRHALAGPHAPP